mgnify:CR=1 FL=1
MGADTIARERHAMNQAHIISRGRGIPGGKPAAPEPPVPAANHSPHEGLAPREIPVMAGAASGHPGRGVDALEGHARPLNKLAPFPDNPARRTASTPRERNPA